MSSFKIGDRVILSKCSPILFGRKGVIVGITLNQGNYWFGVKWDNPSEISWVGNALELDTQWIRDNKLNELLK